ncbi:MAG: lysophospholipid acyltransferase family protein [Thermodesulfobacteriota bacterium]
MSVRRRHPLNHPWMYRGGVALVRHLPRRFNRTWARWLADLNFWRLRESREAVCANLEPLLGPDRRTLRAATRRLFRNYAEQLVDYAYFFGGGGRPAEGFFTRAEGYEHLEAARLAGRGVILATAHLGFWELGGLLFRQWGHPVHVLTLEDPDPGVHEERLRIRTHLGIRSITVSKDPWSSLAVGRALREGALVAMLVDRYAGPDPVSVALFGRRTRFAPGPALFARMTGAAVVPSFVLADGRGGYRGLILPPVPMEFSRDRETDLRENAQRLADATGGVIAEYPDQWFNFALIWSET